MPVRFEFLGPLKAIVAGEEAVELEAGTVGQALEELSKTYAGLAQRLLEDGGSLHRHINIYVNEEDIRLKENLQTPLAPGDVVTVISAIAGG